MNTKLFAFLMLFFAITTIAMAEDYPKSRPGENGETTKVDVSFYIIDVEGIDSKEQNFTLDVIIRLNWKDPRLAGVEGPLPLYSIWQPNVQIYNLRDIDKRYPESVSIQPDGTVEYTQRYYLTLSSRLDLKKFPFDTQKLPISLYSVGYSPDEVQLEMGLAGAEKEFSISDWHVDPIGATTSDMKINLFDDAAIEISRSRIDYEFKASRYIQFYWFNVLAPLMVILFLSWAVFWIDPSAVGPQIGVSGTSILSLVAFLYKLDNILPPVSYLTHMDYFIFISLGMVFIAYLEALISTSIASSGKKELALKLDLIFRIGYPILFVIIIYLFWFN